jgi:hypothetical protein
LYLSRCNYEHGLPGLFQAEAEVLRSRRYWSRSVHELGLAGEMVSGNEVIIKGIEGRLKRIEAATIASKLAGCLGHGDDPSQRLELSDDDENDVYDFYGCRAGRTGTYGFIREGFHRAVAVRLGDARRDISLGKTFWAFNDAGRFKPASALLSQLYNEKELEKVAIEEATARSKAVSSEEGFSYCNYCGEPYALLACNNCDVSFYCNEEHRAADEVRHLVECEEWQAELSSDEDSVDEEIVDGTTNEKACSDENMKNSPGAAMASCVGAIDPVDRATNN